MQEVTFCLSRAPPGFCHNFSNSRKNLSRPYPKLDLQYVKLPQLQSHGFQEYGSKATDNKAIWFLGQRFNALKPRLSRSEYCNKKQIQGHGPPANSSRTIGSRSYCQGQSCKVGHRYKAAVPRLMATFPRPRFQDHNDQYLFPIWNLYFISV